MDDVKKIKYVFFALRPKHWIKNGFLFMPAVFGGILFYPTILFKATLSFVIFSLTSSSAYLINDLLDIEKDKLHPIKRLRPLASGRVKPSVALSLSIALATASLFFAFKLNASFGFTVVMYLVFNLMYSRFIRHILFIDVFCIGLFFLLRIIAGAFVTDIELSHWIVLCVFLLALFLGFNKRRQESKLLKRIGGEHRKTLEYYDFYLIDQICAILASTILVAYTLYTVDERTIRIFGTSRLIFTVPFVYYGVFRYMYLIHKKTGEGDPIRILLSDRNIIINIMLWLLACIMIIYGRI